MIENYAPVIIKLLVSLAFGAVIGLEREFRETAAGLRTHTLVCLGATIFTLASILFGGPNVDISRIAGQVVVGIGFIGGGVIFKSKTHVRGLATAATLWITAAIGILAGIGEYIIGVIALAITMLILIGGTYVEQQILHKRVRN